MQRPISLRALFVGWTLRALRPGPLRFAAVTTFSVGFLGYKVSHVDAHEVRERLLADGHVEAGGVGGRRGREHVLRHARGGLEVRKEAARARRPTVASTSPAAGADLAGDVFAGLPGQRRRRVAERGDAELVARDVGAIGASRPTAPGPCGAFVRCRTAARSRLLRDPARAGNRRVPRCDGLPRRGLSLRRAGPPRDRAHRHRPWLLTGPPCWIRPAAPRARGRRDPGLEPLRLSSSRSTT